ncbi:hypothetical protein J5J10_05410 [Ciceribacter sp. L1K23]|uniref:hypothetical protein n=1 Tax=unclassified Ciceribacter TaxID=2628820 RepID=UPI001ABE3653|nr:MULTISPECIES: hypothetical protein [unclassified Ciceribacter]MBO3760827.1 hypothetical protein [Ciceribacter sp. L1K22]MBR0555114.1 hypothetical protein [Ciceribacter sp. L1K23]
MTTATAETPRTMTVVALLLALGAVSGLVFAGWMRFGADILLAFSQNGLSWCL